MKRFLVALAAVLITLLPVASAQAHSPQAPKNIGISGMWVGTNYGYENGTYKSSDVRYTVTDVDGVTFTGTKSWRQSDGTWSEPENFDGVLYRSGELHAVDQDGFLIGRLVSPTKIRATYLESGDDRAALVTVLTKASR